MAMSDSETAEYDGQDLGDELIETVPAPGGPIQIYRSKLTGQFNARWFARAAAAQSMDKDEALKEVFRLGTEEFDAKDYLD